VDLDATVVYGGQPLLLSEGYRSEGYLALLSFVSSLQ